MRQGPVEELAQVLECSYMWSKHKYAWHTFHFVCLVASCGSAVALFQSRTPLKEMAALMIPWGTTGDLFPHFSLRWIFYFFKILGENIEGRVMGLWKLIISSPLLSLVKSPHHYWNILAMMRVLVSKKHVVKYHCLVSSSLLNRQLIEFME